MNLFKRNLLKRILVASSAITVLSIAGWTLAETAKNSVEPIVKSTNTVVLKTNLGDVVIQLDSEKAPISTANFQQYIMSGFYDGTAFHRTIPDFMVQGGGFDQDLVKKETLAPIQNEADNGLVNTVGSVAMARTSEPHSATSQFFINVADNGFLNQASQPPGGWGYAVFGQVVEGLDIVQAMSKVSTSRVGPHANVPTDSIVIEKAFFK